MGEGESSSPDERGLPADGGTGDTPLRLRDTTAFRSVLAQALGLGIAIAALGLVFAALATRQLVAEVDRGLLALAGELAAIAATGDEEALRASVDGRTSKTTPDGPLLGMRSGGAVIVGNVRDWPPALATVPVWTRVDAPDGLAGLAIDEPSRSREVRGLRVVLGPERELFVGRPASPGALARTPVLALAVGALGLTGVLAVAAALLIGRRLVLPLARMNASLSGIGGGDASGRLSAGPREDEFAALAMAINGMLDRIEILLTEQRRVHETIAHDLRHPLARARTELLEEGQADEAARTRALIAIDEALRAFDALLDLRTLGGEGLRSTFEAVDLGTLAEDVADFYTPFLEEEGMSLVVDVAVPVSVAGDADLLFRVLANLVENAVQHGRAAALRLCVDDAVTGPDLSLEERGHREAAGAGPVHGGHGLGLALADRIMAVHGGRIAVDDGAAEQGRAVGAEAGRLLRRTRLSFPPGRA